MSASPAYAGIGETNDAGDMLDRLTRAERLLTARELARLLAISPKTLYSYVERHLIPHFTIETNVRFRGREVADGLRRRGFGGDSSHASAAWNASFAQSTTGPIRPRHFPKRGTLLRSMAASGCDHNSSRG